MLLRNILMLFLTSNCFRVQAIRRFVNDSRFFQSVPIDINPVQNKTSVDHASKLPSAIFISFFAFGEYFEVTARKTREVAVGGYIDEKITVKIVGTENSTFIWKPPFYQARRSSWMGWTTMVLYDVHKNTIIGFITMEDKTYYIEPLMYYDPSLNPKYYFVSKVVDGLEFVLHPYQSKDKVFTHCFMELIADSTVYEAMNKDINAIVSRIYWHVRYANMALQKVKKGSKILRLSPQNIIIYDTAKYPFQANYTTADEYMKHFSNFTSNACMVGAFTAKGFGNTKGIAVGSSACPNLSDGLQQRNRLIVMLRGHYNDADYVIQLPRTLARFAHEVAHTFGAVHNSPTGDKNCFLAYDGLNYLLSPLGNKSYPYHIGRFSPCNIRRMDDYIREKGKCLQ